MPFHSYLGHITNHLVLATHLILLLLWMMHTIMIASIVVFGHIHQDRIILGIAQDGQIKFLIFYIKLSHRDGSECKY
jgi:hypothetical protein